MPSSGNSYKVRLLLSLLRMDVETVDLEDQTPAIEKAKAQGQLPFQKAPVLQLDDRTLLPESNAILWYLGEGSPFVPAAQSARAQMLSWMFWEQNQHEPVIAVRAALRSYPHRRHLATPERMAELLDRGHALLQIMQDRLASRDWLAGDAPSLADICLYGYTHPAGSVGGFEMSRFPALTGWLARMAALPGYVALDD